MGGGKGRGGQGDGVKKSLGRISPPQIKDQHREKDSAWDHRDLTTSHADREGGGGHDTQMPKAKAGMPGGEGGVGKDAQIHTHTHTLLGGLHTSNKRKCDTLSASPRDPSTSTLNPPPSSHLDQGTVTLSGPPPKRKLPQSIAPVLHARPLSTEGGAKTRKCL